MMDAGYTPARCHWLVTCATLAFQQSAAVQARRNALRIVADVKPERIAEALNVSKATISGDLSNCSTTKQSKPAKTASNPKGAGRPKKKRMTGGLRVIDGDGAAQS
jgi:hypothetical protein